MKMLKLIVPIVIIFYSYELFAATHQDLKEPSLYLDGRWEISVSKNLAKNNIPTFITAKPFTIKQNDMDIAFVREESTIATGKIERNKVELECSFNDKTYIFDGYASSNEILGIIKTGNNLEIPFKATRLTTTFKCGNHDPCHMAINIDEIKDLTKKNNCRYWEEQ